MTQTVVLFALLFKQTLDVWLTKETFIMYNQNRRQIASWGGKKYDKSSNRFRNRKKEL